MQRLNFIKNIIFVPYEIHTASCLTANSIKDYYGRKNKEEVIVLVVLEGARKFSRFLFSKEWLGTYDKFKVFNIKVSGYIDGKKMPDGGVHIDFMGQKIANGKVRIS